MKSRGTDYSRIITIEGNYSSCIASLKMDKISHAELLWDTIQIKMSQELATWILTMFLQLACPSEIVLLCFSVFNYLVPVSI